MYVYEAYSPSVCFCRDAYYVLVYVFYLAYYIFELLMISIPATALLFLSAVKEHVIFVSGAFSLSFLKVRRRLYRFYDNFLVLIIP